MQGEGRIFAAQLPGRGHARNWKGGQEKVCYVCTLLKATDMYPVHSNIFSLAFGILENPNFDLENFTIISDRDTTSKRYHGSHVIRHDTGLGGSNMENLDGRRRRPPTVPESRLCHVLPDGHENIGQNLSESRRRYEVRGVCAVEEIQNQRRRSDCPGARGGS